MVSDFIRHPFHCLFALLTARLNQTNESSWQVPVAKISVPTMPLEKPQRTQSLTIESTVVQNANWLTMAVKNHLRGKFTSLWVSHQFFFGSFSSLVRTWKNDKSNLNLRNKWNSVFCWYLPLIEIPQCHSKLYILCRFLTPERSWTQFCSQLRKEQAIRGHFSFESEANFNWYYTYI